MVPNNNIQGDLRNFYDNLAKNTALYDGASFYKDSRSYDTLEGSKAVAWDFVSFKIFISKLPLKRQGGITDYNLSDGILQRYTP